MEEQVMITLISTAHDGVTNSFALTHAERLLSKAPSVSRMGIAGRHLKKAYRFEDGKLILIKIEEWF
jgi:hypothetical protein